MRIYSSATQSRYVAMLTIDNFLEYAEKKIRLDEVPRYIVFVIRVHATPVSGGLEVLCKSLVAQPEALEWAKTSFSTMSTWKASFDSIIVNCSSVSHDMVVVCKCILEQLAPVIAHSHSILAAMPEIELSDKLENGVVGILKSGLERLSRISVQVEHQDLSWVKEFMEQEVAHQV